MHHNNQEEDHENQKIAEIETELLQKIDIPYFKNNPDYINLWIKYYKIKKDIWIVFLMKFKKISSDFHWLYVELAKFFSKREKPEVSSVLLRNAKKLNVYDPNIIDEEIRKYKDINSVNENDIYHLLNPKNFYVLGKTWNAHVIKFFYKKELFIDEEGNEMSIEEYRHKIWIRKTLKRRLKSCKSQICLPETNDFEIQSQIKEQTIDLQDASRFFSKDCIYRYLFSKSIMRRLQKHLIKKFHCKNSLRDRNTQIVRYYSRDTKINRFLCSSQNLKFNKILQYFEESKDIYSMLNAVPSRSQMNKISGEKTDIHKKNEELQGFTSTGSLYFSDFVFYKKINDLIIVTDKFLNSNLFFILETTENLNLIYNKKLKFVPKLEKVMSKHLVFKYNFLSDLKSIFNLIGDQKKSDLMYFYSLKILKIIRYFFNEGFVPKAIKLDSFVLTEHFNVCFLDVGLLMENHKTNGICISKLIEELNLYMVDRIDVTKAKDISIVDLLIREYESKLLSLKTFDVRKLITKHRIEILTTLSNPPF